MQKANKKYFLYKTRNFLSENRYIILAFLISAGILSLVYIVRRIYPFGGQTVLRVDLYHQYAPYIEELHSRILEGKSLIYSWEGGLGKDFVSQMAYYTASPFNLLMFLFPEKNLPEMIALFILLKISCCSATFSWYLKNRYGKNDLPVLIFGLLYGFCAFLTCYYWNIMWLDTVILFPLTARGCEKLLREGKTGLYYASLTITMIVNFYLAVLVCIFLVLYFLCGCIGEKRFSFRILARFCLVSVLAAMTSLFILAPVARALGATEVSRTAFPRFQLYDNVWQLASAHFLGARAAVLARNEDLPNIYSGLLTLVLLPAWFALRSVTLRRKLSLAFLPVFLLLCSCIRPLDYLIHGMHFPANLPHRFTFMYSFILLIMAYEAIRELETVRLKWCLTGCILFSALVMVMEFAVVPRIREIDRVLSNTDLVLSLGAIALYLILLLFMKKKAGSLLPGILILFAVIFECGFSCVSNLEDTGSREAYVRYMDDAKDAVAWMDQDSHGDFYRAEFRRFTTINDASLYHYRGFSQFSSLEPGGIANFMSHLGIAATGNSFRYYDPTPLIDAMFDIRYVLNKDEAHPKSEKYVFLKQFGTVWVYGNPRWLSLGFMTDRKLLDWSVKDSQPFAVQNDFVRKAAGVKEDMFTPIEPDSLKTENILITPVSGKTGGSEFSYTVNNPEDLGSEPAVTADYTSRKDQYVYLYVDAGNAQRFIYANDSVREDRELSAGRSLIDVGHMSAGERLHVEFRLTRRGVFEKTYRESGSVALYCASYDDEVFRQAYEELAKCQMHLSDYNDTRLEGTIEAAESGLLFTSIPWSDGWRCFIDDDQVSTLPIGDDGVIGVTVEKGAHRIRFEYRQWILLPSLLLSAAGLVLYLILYRRSARASD